MRAQECGQLSTWDKMFYRGGDEWIGFGRVVVLIVQSLSRVWLFVTPWIAARQASLSFTVPQSLLKLMSIELVMPSNHLIPWHPILLLPSVFGWVAWPNLETGKAFLTWSSVKEEVSFTVHGSTWLFSMMRGKWRSDLRRPVYSL